MNTRLSMEKNCTSRHERNTAGWFVRERIFCHESNQLDRLAARRAQPATKIERQRTVRRKLVETITSDVEYLRRGCIAVRREGVVREKAPSL